MFCKKKIVAIAFATVLVLGLTNMVDAQTITRSINGVSFSAYSTVFSSYGASGTTAGDNSFYGYVSSTYTSTNSYTGVSTTQTNSKSGSGSSAALSFSAGTGKKSTSIVSAHSAICGTETWSGSTSAVR